MVSKKFKPGTTVWYYNSWGERWESGIVCSLEVAEVRDSSHTLLFHNRALRVWAIWAGDTTPSYVIKKNVHFKKGE